MRLTLPAILFTPVLWAGSSLLTQTARDVLLQPDGRARAEIFLQQAIVESPDDVEPLTLLAVLKSADLKNNPDELLTQVEPMLGRLLMLREQNPATKPAELALALELNMLILDQVDRAPEAQLLRTRAQTIRKQVIHDMHDMEAALQNASGVFRVGGGVAAPTVLLKSDPEYTEEARLAKISGTVLISVVVDVDGVPKEIELVRGIGFGLDEKAAQTIAAWRFRPGTKDGQPVPVKAQIEINLRLL
jgi:TonB family protein